ncbi:ComF family protein [Propionicicella superfundia]|uniref:ComF family protein n=1 Tax=Propionicicella superfundia TaxID=348582 RepID=UPI000A00C755|nr:phosphoribosyltransferase family protein [Propionicicella superfundia]
MRVWDATLDVLLAGRCAGCGAPGRTLCPGCRSALAGERPWRVELPVPVVAAHEYRDPVRGLVVAYKERGAWTLAGPLGRRLAIAAARVWGGAGPPAPLTVVPVPSRAEAVRERGLDTTLHLSRMAVGVLRRSTGVPVRVVAALRIAGQVEDQAGLDTAGRRANVAGAFRARPLPDGLPAVLVDDVCTTGATLGEAVRAARAAGWDPLGAAVVAAVRLRSDASRS